MPGNTPGDERQDEPPLEGVVTLGLLLRQQRIAAGLTQEALAERAGLGTRSIQHLEGDDARPLRETVRRLVAVLGLVGVERARFEAAARPGPRRRGVGPGPSPSEDRSARRPAGGPPRHNLPAPLTSFIGREGEIAALVGRLPATRLLTLAGPGGCGKTRLALQVASAVLGDYPDGVWQVDLAPLDDPSFLVPAVAGALGVREAPGQPLPTTLTRTLRARHLLLVLDNCEHLVEACTGIVEAILRAAPAVRVLATSREPLRAEGEVLYRVPSLETPPLDPPPLVEDLHRFAAVRLFVERAGLVRPGLAVTPSQMRAAAAICRQLDGLPLALELAAARVGVLSVEQIAERLDDRFALLTRGRRMALPRQQTLGASIDWSYDLLAERERSLLRRLAVFRGWFTLEAAEAVCGGASDLLDSLAHLVDTSLVLADERGTPVHYRLLETIRQYAGAKLAEAGEDEDARARHCDWYIAVAERFGWGLAIAEMAPGGQLDAVEDNLRAALDWCRERDVPRGLRLTGSLAFFWRGRGLLAEGRQWVEEMLARADSTARAGPSALDRARSLATASVLAKSVGDQARARLLAEESLALFRELADPSGIAWALILIAVTEGDGRRAQALLEESLAVGRQVEDKVRICHAVRQLADLARQQGDDARARELYEQSLALAREIGDPWSIGWSLVYLAEIAMYAGAHGRARSLFDESVAIFQDQGMPLNVGTVLGRLGELARLQGDGRRARALLRDGLGLMRDSGESLHIATLLGFAGNLAIQEGEPARGVRLLACAAAIALSSEDIVDREERAVRLAGIATARSALGDASFATAWAEGQAMTPEQAVAYALEANGGWDDG